ncbi:PREDICTED: major allergen Equ c 1-like [Ceratotherium simum simum]|uniref:Major allergen Equ c 1-like n=1 Tax=Ceratotherium simum simum TaxID=73337 RepID=A0ABM0HBW9_CERSS|nr:PREDICTED: major allergen Equ c 1-like [Ceratotherium simum simum]
MKLLLLCLGLILVCAQEEENSDVVTNNFDISEISGEWYSILLASDIKEKIEENGSMRVFVEYIHVLDNSSLYFKYHTKVNGQCTQFSVVADKIGENHIYNVTYDGYNVFHIRKVVNTDSIIIYLVNFNNDEPFQLLELYARKPDASPEVKEKLKGISQKHGIVTENIIDLTKADRCLQDRENGEDEA